MESVFNIEPENIQIRDKIQDRQYNFLDSIDLQYKEIYYKIVSSIIDYKLKNLYRFIYLRLYSINKKYPIVNVIENVKTHISPEEFNHIIDSFINGNKRNAIIIMNSIQLYIT